MKKDMQCFNINFLYINDELQKLGGTAAVQM